MEKKSGIQASIPYFSVALLAVAILVSRLCLSRPSFNRQRQTQRQRQPEPRRLYHQKSTPEPEEMRGAVPGPKPSRRLANIPTATHTTCNYLSYKRRCTRNGIIHSNGVVWCAGTFTILLHSILICAPRPKVYKKFSPVESGRRMIFVVRKKKQRREENIKQCTKCG